MLFEKAASDIQHMFKSYGWSETPYIPMKPLLDDVVL